MPEHYSNKIQNVIQKELFKANKSIKIAVAWFTNDLLYQPLVLKLQTGVTVELVLNKDVINDSENNDVCFDEFISLGGILHWNDSKRLMHEKFCIIDDSIVIYGSYNWTNKAEYNDESVAVSRGEEGTLQFYLKQFYKLCSDYPAFVFQKMETKNESPINNDVPTEPIAKGESSEEELGPVEPNVNKSLNVMPLSEIRYCEPSLLQQSSFGEERNRIRYLIEKGGKSKEKIAKLKEYLQQMFELAEQGDPSSCLCLATCYKYGIVFEQDYKLAKEWFMKSSRHSNAEAMVELAIDFTSEEGKEACNLIKDAAELLHPFAKKLAPDICYFGNR